MINRDVLLGIKFFLNKNKNKKQNVLMIENNTTTNLKYEIPESEKTTCTNPESENCDMPKSQDMDDNLWDETEKHVKTNFVSQPEELMRSTNRTPEFVQRKTARKSFNTPDTIIVWKSVYGEKISNVTCKICEEKTFNLEERSKWHLGHVISLYNYGSNDLTNLRPICSGCNRKMGAENMIEYCRNRYPDRFEEIINNLCLENVHG